MSIFQRISSEWAYLTGAVRMLGRATPIAKHPTHIFPVMVEELATRFSNRPALIGVNGITYSYAQMNARANRYARWARAQGIGKGDVVALLMGNRPEYAVIWIGLARAGAAIALQNTNLRGTQLAHCLNVVRPKAVIVADDLLAAYTPTTAHTSITLPLWVYGANGHNDTAHNLEALIETYDDTPLTPHERPALTIEDPCLLIYTSGTTGLPKAANINHYRVMLAANGFSAAMNATKDDRMYDCLPMYHTVGGVVALGAVLSVGGALIIKDKFSASEFWSDSVRYECTLFQYIGELLRYLVNSPTHPAELQHRIRLCCGNGLRPDVWDAFAQRFKIPQILEFYAATEGNVTIFNLDSKPGSIGRVPWWLEHRFVIKLVEFDYEAEMPVRGMDGHCIECEPGVVGEAIGQILNDPSKPAARFEGYADKDATQKKVLHDVFSSGDAWFRTGDLLKKDRLGYFYFIDRVGDTFRWKGENVATSEVAEALTGFDGILEANVYGVPVEGRDGRAGMAEIVVAPAFNLDALDAYMKAHLSEYARPLFLRIAPTIDMTGTFKQKKVELVKQGFDPAACHDCQLYFSDARAKRFVPLDPALYQAIQAGQVKL